ncbi:unnamed protein product [Prunus armeniaca]|uniref:Uncharacterized protein n=1 Tax=Prunus armeniaca TaxID=36596 RepID=A0A6J5Y396_PRUAR|nr:unnamed protein product [Prunus armeniaca]
MGRLPFFLAYVAFGFFNSRNTGGFLLLHVLPATNTERGCESSAFVSFLGVHLCPSRDATASGEEIERQRCFEGKKVSVQKTRPKLTSPTSSATSLALSSTVASETRKLRERVASGGDPTKLHEPAVEQGSPNDQQVCYDNGLATEWSMNDAERGA